jgi:hypothetical protein
MYFHVDRAVRILSVLCIGYDMRDIGCFREIYEEECHVASHCHCILNLFIDR